MTDAASTDNGPRSPRVVTPRGRPFEPGNPGRPKGALHKVTRAVQALLDGEAEEITRKVIEAAKAGDSVAMRLIFDRIAPAQRERTIEFAMPTIESVADLPAALLAIMQACAGGDITPGEATQLAGMLEHYRRQSETADLEARIAMLEEVGRGSR